MVVFDDDDDVDDDILMDVYLHIYFLELRLIVYYLQAQEYNNSF